MSFKDLHLRPNCGFDILVRTLSLNNCGISGQWLHLLLLLLWIAIGSGLRLANLEGKPPWTDEFCTMVFSLGNSFQSVSLDRAIALDVLLRPLQPNPAAPVGAVVHHLLSESNHPPLYFVLAHWWMKLFKPHFATSLSGEAVEYVSLWVARSLPALLGVASIPAVYSLALLSFRSQTVGQLAAATMAVSPYGIFLAQEARHYTLAILWVIASLCCLAVAVRYIQQCELIPFWLIFGWITVNFLGISTHYFLSLTLCAEAIVLIGFWISGSRFTINLKSQTQNLKSLFVVAVGTAIGGLIWLPVFLSTSQNDNLTEWIQSDGRVGILAWIGPVFQALAGWITMICLLPVEAPLLPVVIASGAVMMVFFLWAIPILSRGLKTQLQQAESRVATELFVGVVCSAIALFFIITYGFGIDLTRGARYNFVYFPAVIVAVGASLAACWKDEAKKTAVAIIWLMGFVSAITVVCNLGYQKYYRPDLLVSLINQQSNVPVLIATTHKTHVQIGEMMGIAWEFQRYSQKTINAFRDSSANLQFLLAHQEQDPKTSTVALHKTLAQLPRPLDLWLVNFYAPEQLNSCFADTKSSRSIDGYNYKIYHCN